jgi:hypothetical protein
MKLVFKNSISPTLKKYLLQIIAFHLIILFTISLSASAQTSINELTPPQISDFSATLGFLSSGWMEGRESGTRGALLAADYIASMMHMFQLIPFENIKAISNQPVYSKNYFQDFEIINYKTESSELALILKSGNSVISYPFSLGVDFELKAGPNSLDAEVPVIFAGYGINAGEKGYNDYKTIDVKGKIAVIIDGFPGHLDSNSLAWKKFAKTFNDDEEILEGKIETARQQGAIALIIADASGKYQAWHKNQINNRLFALSKDSNQLAEPIYEESDYTLPADFRNSNIPVYKVSTGVGNQILAETGINLAVFQKNASVSLTTSSLPLKDKALKIMVDVKKDALKVRNILGMIPGIDSSKYLIIGAHYDHLGSRNGLIYNGADDNASGVAGLIALAKTWSQSRIKPPCNIIFASWTAEELRLLGSRYFVQNLNIDPKNILLYINSACKKTQCRIRKRQVRGLRSQKKRSLLFVNEHFSDKCNEEIGVFLPTLFKLFTLLFIA